MSRKVSLPDGGWAALRDPKQVPERLRRPIMQRLPGFDDVDQEEVENAKRRVVDSETLAALFELRDVVIVAFVEQWSLDQPVTVETVMDLPSEVYDALEAECGPLIQQLVNPPGPGDPKSPQTASPSSATG